MPRAPHKALQERYAVDDCPQNPKEEVLFTILCSIFGIAEAKEIIKNGIENLEEIAIRALAEYFHAEPLEKTNPLIRRFLENNDLDEYATDRGEELWVMLLCVCGNINDVTCRIKERVDSAIGEYATTAVGIAVAISRAKGHNFI